VIFPNGLITTGAGSANSDSFKIDPQECYIIVEWPVVDYFFYLIFIVPGNPMDIKPGYYVKKNWQV